MARRTIRWPGIPGMAKVAGGIAAARLRGKRIPLFVGAALTNRCDGECIYCRRAGPEGDELDTAAWIGLLEQMARAGTFRVSFTGGEPLVREDVGRLMFEAQRSGLTVNLCTNGYLLESRLDEVVRADSLTLSYDGPEDVMDGLRGKGSHTRALRGLGAALGAGMPCSLHATLSVLNVDRVDEILEEARSLGVRVSFAPLRSVPLGEGDRSLFPGESEFRTAIERLIHLKKRGNGNILNSLSCLHHLGHWPEPTSIACSAGRIYARVEADGEMYACGDEVLTGGHVSARELGFGQAFERLRPSACDACWCDTRVEMNLVYAMNSLATMEAFLR